MAFLILLGLSIAVIFGPHIWAKRTLQMYSDHRDEIPGTGGELAQHLLDRLRIKSIRVEEADMGDHYDPVEKVVRLTPDVLNGKSLTAIVVAAHEVGHAIQDHLSYRPLHVRTKLVALSHTAEKAGSAILIALPFIATLTLAPVVGALMLFAGIATLSIPVLIHLITLPVEFDASFRRALPILAAGYVPHSELRAARRILTACALTYVAASLATLLNFWRWISILRR